MPKNPPLSDTQNTLRVGSWCLTVTFAHSTSCIITRLTRLFSISDLAVKKRVSHSRTVSCGRRGGGGVFQQNRDGSRRRQDRQELSSCIAAGAGGSGAAAAAGVGGRLLARRQSARARRTQVRVQSPRHGRCRRGTGAAASGLPGMCMGRRRGASSHVQRRAQRSLVGLPPAAEARRRFRVRALGVPGRVSERRGVAAGAVGRAVSERAARATAGSGHTVPTGSQGADAARNSPASNRGRFPNKRSKINNPTFQN